MIAGTSRVHPRSIRQGALLVLLVVVGCNITINKGGDDDDDDDWGDGTPTTDPASPFDGGGAGGSDNTGPQATITSHSDGDHILEGHVVSFMGSVSDDEDVSTDLQVRWLSDERVLCEATSPSADNFTTCEATLWDSGDITLEVTDTDGASTTESITLGVVATEAPSVAILYPSSDSIYYADQPISFSAVVSDAEDEPADLSVTWGSSNDGELVLDATPASDGSIFSTTYLSEGEHALTLTATDSTGKTGMDSVVISVGPENHAPSCTIVSPTNGDVFAEDTLVEFVGLISDPDVPASMLEVTWSSDREGLLSSTSPSSDGDVHFVTTDLSAGTHSIVLQANDELGATCNDTVTIRLESDDEG